MPKMKFRLLAGRHYDGDREYVPRAIIEKFPDRYSGATDIVDSDIDLVKRFGVEKFQRLYDEQVREEQARRESIQNDGLDSMSLDELRKYALTEKIDLGKAKTKPEIIETIRTAFAPA